MAEWPKVSRLTLRVEQDVAVPSLDGDRWLYVWNRDPLGDCCCGNTACTSPGKHPWAVRRDGEWSGFSHGAADAVSWESLQALHGPVGGRRQVAVCLSDVVVLDLDNARAVRDFARISGTIPRERIMGVSITPRGYHVWLDMPGWNQKALNAWMGSWLQEVGWDPVSEEKAGRRGIMLDVRTGERRYVVWPGGVGSPRRWLPLAEFGKKIGRLRADMPPWRLVTGLSEAPWQVEPYADDMLAEWIGEQDTQAEITVPEGWTLDGSMGELESSWDEMVRWCERLTQMAPGAGRNNCLNQVAYYSGGLCVAAGHPVSAVEDYLVDVGRSVGTHGVEATVRSGLSAGVRAVSAKKAGVA